MTDIKELARTLRQAAEEELMCREASDTSDLWQDEASPENVLALVEALEILQQENRVSELEGDLAAEEERRGNWFRMAEELGGKLDAAEEHIRELDKRLIEYAGIATREAHRVAELEKYRTAFMEWHDKTAWVQTDKRFDAIKPWGKHRADVLKEYIEHLEARQIALPQRLSPEGYHIDEAYMVDDAEGEYLDRDAVIEAISAAGIKVKGE
ncbi:ead/Ea22-like family protein [Salmonella enterica subsp. enterica]|nr:ead/Ea22-like family protein [Salmonella enterica subsp. enterica]